MYYPRWQRCSARLVCIDIQPYGSTQAPERADILNVGGFRDVVFNVVTSYLSDDDLHSDGQ